MTICDFCDKTLFSDLEWEREPKDHHAKADAWAYSVTEPCTICICLLDGVRTAIYQRAGTDYNLGLEPTVNAGVLQCIKNVLPLYKVTLRELAERNQYSFMFRPIDEKVKAFELATPVLKICDL